MPEAETREERPLLLAAGRGEDLRARLSRELDRRQTDTTRCRVNQDALARAQAGEIVQCVMGCDERHGYAGGLLECQMRRLGRDELSPGDRHAAQAVRGECDDLIAHAEAI